MGWNPVRWALFALDAIIRWAAGVQPLADDPQCLFRIAVKSSPRRHRLTDGTEIRAGDRVIELHLWNEHIPRMPAEGPDLQWARAFYNRFRYSLHLLAQRMETDPILKESVAIYGRLFVHLGHRQPEAVLIRRLGFEFRRVPEPTSLPGRIGRFFVTLYAGWLAWAYNPGSLRVRDIWEKDLVEVWMSRRRLLVLHGAEPSPKQDGPSSGTREASS